MPTNKHQVITCHKLHPRWSSVQIAEHLGCCDAYVRATFKRNGLRLHKAHHSSRGRRARRSVRSGRLLGF